MRYYSFALNANSEQIKEKTSINLREYAYENTISAVNNYMYKTIRNGLAFCAYREEGNIIFAVFSHDEKKNTFRESFAYITEILNSAFAINRIKNDPYEITMYQALDFILEARRRDYMTIGNRFIEASNLWIYNYYNNDTKTFHFDFKEEIVSVKANHKKAIYDHTFLDELSNIEKHENNSEFGGNMVHYVISSRSVEATKDMTETLMQNLIKAKRIRSRRMEIISAIEPDVYRVQNHLDEIIEGNQGGVIVFDLTEKFGYDLVDYTLTSKYIENLLKEYRSKCLFVFTYNMDNPGFSYQLLPKIKKYVIPVMLREGRGDRRAAIKYMKALIKDSEYAEYAGQASEFMKLFPGNDFTQTDVLMAYEQFEAWCLNKNVLRAYNYDLSQDFMLDRDEASESSYDKLSKLIGLDIVKKQIESIIASDVVEKERRKRKGKDYQSCSMHMIFGGNPGSAKTTVAKLFAGIAKEKGILKSGSFVERGGMDLNGLGCVTAIREAFLAAKGGVLFIDEAYSMVSDTAVSLKDINWTNRAMRIVRKGGDEQIVYFNKDIEDALTDYIKYERKSPDDDVDALFVSRNRTRISVSAVERMVKKYAATAVPQKAITPHKLRATFATELNKANDGDLLQVSVALGHSSIETVKRYADEADLDRQKVPSLTNWTHKNSEIQKRD